MNLKITQGTSRTKSFSLEQTPTGTRVGGGTASSEKPLWTVLPGTLEVFDLNQRGQVQVTLDPDSVAVIMVNRATGSVAVGHMNKTRCPNGFETGEFLFDIRWAQWNQSTNDTLTYVAASEPNTPFVEKINSITSEWDSYAQNSERFNLQPLIVGNEFVLDLGSGAPCASSILNI